MFAVIWEYTVHPGCEDAFEALYGAGGAWAALFAGQPGYRATELLHADGSRRYVTIDRWDRPADYDAFLATEHSRYAAIDAEGDRLTESQRCIGRYGTGARDGR